MQGLSLLNGSHGIDPAEYSALKGEKRIMTEKRGGTRRRELHVIAVNPHQHAASRRFAMRGIRD